MRLSLFAFVVGAVLLGCQGSPGASASSRTPAATPSEASATATPTDTPERTPTIDELGTAYLSCVEPFNAILSELQPQYAALTKLRDIRRLDQQAADALGVLIACIRAMPWPAELEADVHAKVTADTALQVTQLALARAPNFDEYNRLAEVAADQWLASGSASNLLRSDLGLSPPPPL